MSGLNNNSNSRKRECSQILDLNSILNKPKNTTTKTTKKQKTTTITTKFNEINIEELDKKRVDELKCIANSIGISITSNIRKLDLIEKIKHFIKINNDAITTQTIKETNNPFNKSTFNTLVIPDGIDGKMELLFWKVFKNKSIFKHIMSFMNIFGNCIQYDCLISVYDMIKCGQVQILKDKVKNNQNLSFFKRYDGSREYNHIAWEQIFKTIKDDNEFYLALFKNYGNQLPFNNFSKNEFEGCFNKLIELDCLVGMNVLIQEFNYIPTNDNLGIAFRNSKLQSINLILETIQDKSKIFADKYPLFNGYCNINQVIESIKIFKETFKDADNPSTWVRQYNLDPMKLKLQELISMLQLLDTLNLWGLYENSNFNYPMVWLIKTQLYQPPVTIPPTKEESSIIMEEMKSFKFSTQQLDSTLNDPINYSSNEKEIIKKLLHVYYRVRSNDTNRFVINKDELIEYYICYGSSGVGSGAGSDNDYNYSNIIDSDKIKINPNLGGISIIETAFSHAHYPTVNNWFSNHQSYSSMPINFSEITPFQFDYRSAHGILAPISNSNYFIGRSLFKHCRNNRELQIQFLNCLIKDIQSNTVANHLKLQPMLLFIMLVNFNDLELLKLLVSSLGKDSIRLEMINIQQYHGIDNYFCCFSQSITKYIGSIEMMDYIFNEFYHLIEQQNLFTTNGNALNTGFDHTLNIKCQLLNNFDLLIHYEKLYNEKTQKQFPKQPKKIHYTIDTTTPISVSILQHVVVNQQTYSSFTHLINRLPPDLYSTNSGDNLKIYFETMKQIIQSIPEQSFNPLYHFYKHSYRSSQLLEFLIYNYGNISNQLIKFLIWLYNGDGNQYHSKIKFIPSWEGKYVVACALGEIETFIGDTTIQDITQNYFDQVIQISICKGDLKTILAVIDRALGELNKYQSVITQFLLNLLKSVIKNQQFSILEFLYSNHSRLFKKKVKSNSKSSNETTNNIVNDDAIFTSLEHGELIMTSLENYNFRITEFLLSLFYTTKTQFKALKKSTGHYIAFSYFKNRLNK